MGEPSKFGKTMRQLSDQYDRIYDEMRRRMYDAETPDERKQIVNRFNRMANAYQAYTGRMAVSPTMVRAMQRYNDSNGGTMRGFDAMDVRVPRSQYMGRKNNRR